MDDRIYEVLWRISLRLEVPLDKSELDLRHSSDSDANELNSLVAGARYLGIFLKESIIDLNDVTGLLAEGFPIILAEPDGAIWVLEKLSGGQIEASCFDAQTTYTTINPKKIRELLASTRGTRAFVAKKELECNSMSAAAGSRTLHGHSGEHPEHSHPKPMRRFLALLRLDQGDIWTVTLFALVAGILSLATPLAVESLVNVVSWGTYIQPLIVIAMILLACLGMSGLLKVLQTVVVEMIQRRQFVRIVGDLAHRFPRANQQALIGEYPRELANRFFDTVTIQKASASLLLDGISILLTTFLGLLLLAFYHPFLLGFDLVLLITMLSLTWLLGRGGVRTAIDESKAKYKIAHWLQDVLAMPAAFKLNGGETWAIERANRLTTEYLASRQSQFRVVIRQVVFAISLQAIASTALLGLGGWLVIDQQLTLGQLVASELVVTVVVGAFAKAGKSLEIFYDLMAAIDKVGHLLDIPVDARQELGEPPNAPAEVTWDSLHFHSSASGNHCEIASGKVPSGTRAALFGNDRSGKTLLLKSLAGLVKPDVGIVEISGHDAQLVSLASGGAWVAYAGRPEIFHGTFAENVSLGRASLSPTSVRDALIQVGLWDMVHRLPDGLKSMLQTEGYPLSRTQQAQLSIARAIAGRPRLLLVDGSLDEMTPAVRDKVWSTLAAPDAPWTLIVATHLQTIIEQCDHRFC